MSFIQPEGFHFEIFPQLVKNLPEGMKALILVPNYTGKGSRISDKYADKDLLELLPLESGLREKVEFLRIKKDNEMDPESHGNWSRDFLSYIAIDKEGKPVIIDAKYAREEADKTDAVYIQYLKDYILRETRVEPRVEQVPFYYEGGNLATNGHGLVYISERFFSNNKLDGKPVSLAEARGWFKEVFGAQVKFRVLPSVTEESTGHLDMYVKFLDEKRAVISSNSTDKAIGAQLDQIAKIVASDGVEVTRIPMAIRGKSKEYNADSSFRSYTNAVILGNTIFIPQYSNDALNFRAQDKAAAQVYRKLGFNVVPIDTSTSIFSGGSVHCLTQSIPDFHLADQSANTGE